MEKDDILVTIDVTALYTNINQKEGIEVYKNILNENSNDKAKNDFIIELLEHILKNNIFEFDEMLYNQEIDTAMGSKPAPDYSNIFMAEIDKKILEIAETQKDKLKVKFFKRFLDDIILIFNGTSESLHDFINMINQINPTIKFTVTHTSNPNNCNQCQCKNISTLPFLDTSLTNFEH